MNGQELLEAMSYVEEKYIAAAEGKPARRIHWQPFAAAAACLVLVLVGAWRYLPQPQTKEAAQDEAAPMAMAAGTARSQEAAQDNGPAMMMASPFAQMTVRVLEWTEEGARCQVVDPLTSDFQPEDQVTIILPRTEEAAAQPAAMDLDGEAAVYRVSFLPDGGSDTITADQWIQEEQE